VSAQCQSRNRLCQVAKFCQNTGSGALVMMSALSRVAQRVASGTARRAASSYIAAIDQGTSSTRVILCVSSSSSAHATQKEVLLMWHAFHATHRRTCSCVTIARRSLPPCLTRLSLVRSTSSRYDAETAAPVGSHQVPLKVATPHPGWAQIDPLEVSEGL